jgi:predicted TIM-barrel fold metal-dependent hydrolase
MNRVHRPAGTDYIRVQLIVALVVAALCVSAGAPANRPVPVIDHHQHLFSSDSASLASGFHVIDATDLVTMLDAAGIRRAVLLSTAYQFSSPNRPVDDREYDRVKAENDWTSHQVARYPSRLRGLCGLNPLRDYALGEIERCARDPFLRLGIKLHFGNSDVDLDNPEHVSRLQRVFSAANSRRMAIVIHMRSSISRRRPYGAEEARAFIESVLPAAPDVTVQVAHLAGGGGFDDPAVDDALSTFIRAFGAHDRRVAHVWMDVSGVAGYGHWREQAGLIARRIREIGVGRVLYGSDSANGAG